MQSMAEIRAQHDTFALSDNPPLPTAVFMYFHLNHVHPVIMSKNKIL